MSTFRLSVRRGPDEAIRAWRGRATAVARAEAEARGLVVASLRLEGLKTGPTISAGGPGVIQVTVAGEPHIRTPASA